MVYQYRSGFTNGTIGNIICTNGNANGTIGRAPNGASVTEQQCTDYTVQKLKAGFFMKLIIVFSSMLPSLFFSHFTQPVLNLFQFVSILILNNSKKICCVYFLQKKKP